VAAISLEIAAATIRASTTTAFSYHVKASAQGCRRDTRRRLLAVIRRGWATSRPLAPPLPKGGSVGHPVFPLFPAHRGTTAIADGVTTDSRYRPDSCEIVSSADGHGQSCCNCGCACRSPHNSGAILHSAAHQVSLRPLLGAPPRLLLFVAVGCRRRCCGVRAFSGGHVRRSRAVRMGALAAAAFTVPVGSGGACGRGGGWKGPDALHGELLDEQCGDRHVVQKENTENMPTPIPRPPRLTSRAPTRISLTEKPNFHLPTAGDVGDLTTAVGGSCHPGPPSL